MQEKRQSKAEKHAATRAALLATARALFAARGYAATGTEEVVAQAERQKADRPVLHSQGDGHFDATRREHRRQLGAGLVGLDLRDDHRTARPVERVGGRGVERRNLLVAPVDGQQASVLPEPEDGLGITHGATQGVARDRGDGRAAEQRGDFAARHPQQMAVVGAGAEESVLEGLLDRFGGIELLDDPPCWRRSLTLRGLDSLRVRLAV